MHSILSLFPLAAEGDLQIWPILVGVVVVIFFGVILFAAKQYRRCPSNKILVKFGSVGGSRAAQCIHGGGVYIMPLLQDYAYLSLTPMTIEIDLTGALSKKNIRVNVPSTFTIAISTNPTIVNNAAERLLTLSEQEISDQARDIILGQLRLVIATLTIEEINQDREKFRDLVNKNVDAELNKIGLEVINVNIRDITDESGYIEAIGQKAAAEAINIAKVEVAEQEKDGAIGEASANREKEVSVAEQHAQSAMGQKKAQRDQRISVSQYEADGVSGEAKATRDLEINVAGQRAEAEKGKKQAEMEKRVAVAALEADAVKGENQAQAQIADYQATLQQRQAEARRLGEVALANATKDILVAEKQKEIALLEKTELAQKEVDKKKVEVDAAAAAERTRLLARGEADAILMRYTAEAEGIQRVLAAKAKGYQELLNACGQQKHLAPTLLMVEKLPELVAEQVKAIQNLKIDKITVWDSGGPNQTGSTANFLRGLIGSLPQMHELAKQAGIELPQILGNVAEGPKKSEGGGDEHPAPKK
ncbi:MAG TPA: SPFH domain-containing protein [Planctomycetota bacterium]|nr:SPFH domain-containing protein [Planctomycetota bacterium]